MYSLHREQGFTLVELSIVLVIIGLVIGGVLAGQDMIYSARYRTLIAQLQGYDAAANSFKEKYQAIAGDIASGKANAIGLAARAGTEGHGDGDDTLEGCTAGSLLMGCENVLFWSDLSGAGLISGNYSTAAAAGNAYVSATSFAEVVYYLPVARIRSSTSIMAFSNAGQGYYQLVDIVSVAAGAVTMTPSLTPQEAHHIDIKMDDGMPLSGKVRAAFSTSVFNAVGSALPLANQTAAGATVPSSPVTSLTDCMHGDGASVLNTVYNMQNDEMRYNPSCQLRIRAAF